MPHTSHKKKNKSNAYRNKRAEIVDDDGWVRITTTNPDVRAPRARPVTEDVLLGLKAADSGGGLTGSNLTGSLLVTGQGHGQGHGQVQGQGYTSQPAEGMSVEKLEAQYREVEKKWLASTSWTALSRVLEFNLMQTETLRSLDRCVLLGSGSFCGHVRDWIARFEVSLYQLAAFVAVANTIETLTGHRPELIAQDPVYNVIDIQLLEHLSIEPADHPRGIRLLTSNSLVYAPCAELDVELQTLAALPAVVMKTGKLDHYWRNEKGELCTNRALYDVGKSPSQPVELELLPTSKVGVDGSQDQIEEGFRIVEAFRQHRDVFLLPDLDVRDSPFRDVHVYAVGGKEEDVN